MAQHVIVDVTAEPIDLPLTEPFGIATGVQPCAHNVLVKVVLADDTFGLGEAAPVPHICGETRESTLAAIAEAKAILIGEPASDWRNIARRLRATIPTACAARAALEMAVLDALGKRQQFPLHLLFGGGQSLLPTDMTIPVGDVEHARRSAKNLAQRGIAIAKVKIGATSVEEDIDRLLAIRESAPSLRMYVDANCGHTLANARHFLQLVGKHRIELLLYEQPLPRGHMAAWQELRKTSSIPICADESARTATELLELIRHDAVHAVNLKIMKCGIEECLTMWHLARAAGLKLIIGGMVESILAMTVSAQLAIGLGGFEFADLDTPMFITAHPFAGGFDQRGDLLHIGHITHGHGVTLR